MQAISHSTGTFAPIRASNTQPHTAKAVPEPVSPQTLNNTSSATSGVWEKESFSFWDIIDAINPLQHIPIISTIYRKITGDEMGYASRIAGDTLYGGVLGNMLSSLVSAVANVFVDSTTGKDIGAHVMAAVAPSKTPVQSTTITTRAMPAPTQISSTPPTSATVARQHTEILPAIDPSRIQTGVDQYKWQTMAGEVKNSTDHWA
ncbi:hypothetical protein D8Y20_09030 [Mariprofundus sp. EBB-1]|uniref:hypothetical protein n=1 Tax=Mariprofundus sp. EBB-1 TaxID=2650971 RepID=UPI000EF231D4|nr:hypothetical protein [Mariprofundus sp. EBB-1]RLL51526.1 hypothetical protein D8Y20_09030 [Mariprofundus sp. EBB-1]